MNARPNWAELTGRRQTSAEQPSLNEDTFADVCARVFVAPDGKDLLKHLYAEIVDKRSPAAVSEAVLREAEAQRRLVFEFERLRDVGLERAKNRNKAS